jgi:hypothetical protein
VKPIAAAVALIAAASLLIAPRPGRVMVLRSAEVPTNVPGDMEAYGAPGAVLTGVAVTGDNVYIHDVTIDGRNWIHERQGLPPWNHAFLGFTGGNGIMIDGRRRVTIRNVTFRNIAGFAILVSGSHDITIDRVRIENSGSLNQAGRNNATGGILLEEGTTDFRVTRCDLRNVRGNGIWTHSLYTSLRNLRGVFEDNHFDTIGRDALQAGHAADMRIVDNVGFRIGYPTTIVDATPVGVDTAGNVDHSVYSGNRFRDINGKCLDLDGFHNGEVRGNACADLTGYGIVMNNSNPDMQSTNVQIVGNLIDGAAYGGVFVIGTNNLVARNRLLNLNTAHCNDGSLCYYPPGEPDMLRSGIYLGKGAERPAPARNNVIEDNQITGYEMRNRCIGRAPVIEVGWNTVRNNSCGGVSLGLQSLDSFFDLPVVAR